jgi:hypothetical protein
MTPQLDEQTVVGIGGSADIGLATARAAREGRRRLCSTPAEAR